MTLLQQGQESNWIIAGWYGTVLCFLKWDGHVNFEVCATVKQCKYVYKYILKGHNTIEMGVREKRNEIEDYSNSRYVSSMEAAYHILLLGWRCTWKI